MIVLCNNVAMSAFFMLDANILLILQANTRIWKIKIWRNPVWSVRMTFTSIRTMPIGLRK